MREVKDKNAHGAQAVSAGLKGRRGDPAVL